MACELRIVGMAIVGDLDRGHRRLHEGREALSRVRCVRSRQISGQAEGDLELDDEVHVVGGAHPGGRLVERRLEHHAGLRLFDADKSLHLL